MLAYNNNNKNSKIDESCFILPAHKMRQLGSSKQQFFATLLVTLVVLISCFCLIELASAAQTPNGANSMSGYNSNLDDLISNFLDDGERLKKSKMNGLRQVKQTLRFGRRSDPWFVPSAPEQQLSLEELAALSN